MHHTQNNILILFHRSWFHWFSYAVQTFQTFQTFIRICWNRYWIVNSHEQWTVIRVYNPQEEKEMNRKGKKTVTKLIMMSPWIFYKLLAPATHGNIIHSSVQLFFLLFVPLSRSLFFILCVCYGLLCTAETDRRWVHFSLEKQSLTNASAVPKKWNSIRIEFWLLLSLHPFGWLV